MEFSINEKKVFKEVNEIIDIMGEKYKNKVPKKLLEILKNGEDINYITKIEKDVPFEKQIISRTALILLSYINRNYWIELEEEKQKIKKAYRLEEEKHQKLLREKYNPDEIFKKRGNK